MEMMNDDDVKGQGGMWKGKVVMKSWFFDNDGKWKKTTPIALFSWKVCTGQALELQGGALLAA